MILLRNVTHQLKARSKGRHLLTNQTLTIGDREKIGIHAEPSAGKTTLARLLCKAIEPTFGEVYHTGSVSWPMGIASTIHGELTIGENVTIIARLASGFPERAENTFWILANGQFNPSQIAKTLSPMERAVMGFYLSLMTPRQHYIFDEKMSVGTAEQQALQRSHLKRRMQAAGMVLISRNKRLIREHTNRFFELISGRLIEVSPSEFKSKAVQHV